MIWKGFPYYWIFVRGIQWQWPVDCRRKGPAMRSINVSHIVNQKKQTWWRHQMETFSALLAICAGNSPGTGEFPAQRPVVRSFDVFFDLRPNKQLSKQWWGWWFEAPPWSLRRHRNAMEQRVVWSVTWDTTPDSKVHGANMGSIWGWYDPGGPHVVPMNLAIWVYNVHGTSVLRSSVALSLCYRMPVDINISNWAMIVGSIRNSP